jgi:peptidoglycan biosynthesis protein MviN/MurJ (putative lipid II flippase)
MGTPDSTARRLIVAAATATAAHVVGRAVNVAFPLVLLGLHRPDAHTDAFFLTLAIGFFFFGTLANALTDATVPVLLREGKGPAARHQITWALGSAAAFLAAWTVAVHIPQVGGAPLAIGGTLMVLAGVLAAFPSARLYAGHRFAAPGLLWLLRSLPLLAFVALARDSEAVPWFALGIGLADALRLLSLRHLSTRLPARVPDSHDAPSTIPRTHYVWVVMASAVAGLNPIIDRWIVSLGAPGEVSVLELAERFFGVVGALATVGFANVALVHLSGREGGANWAYSVRATMAWGALWTTVGLAAGLVALPQLYRHWLDLTTTQQAWLDAAYASYTLGIVPLLLGVLSVRRLYAGGWAHWVPPVAVLSLLLNALASYLLFRVMGVPGVALATTLVYCVTAALLLWAVRRLDLGESTRRLLRTEQCSSVEAQVPVPGKDL